MKIKELLSKINMYKKAIIICLGLIIICTIIFSIIFSKSGKVTTITESSLKETVLSSQISTIEYIYNSTCMVKNDKEIKYYVAYEAIVKAGFDFKDLNFVTDDKNKKYIITIPKAKITEIVVDDKSMDFIFMKEKYDTETTFQEAYNKCLSDLSSKAEKNNSLTRMAKENAKKYIEALTKPLQENIGEYTIEVR